MTQSVELTFDDRTDAAVRAQWTALAEAGLPTEQRTTPSPSHRPHVTLFAGDTLADGADADLPALVAGLELPLRIGALLLFGPRRGTLVVVRQVVASAGLLDLQARVAKRCGTAFGQFGPGGWSPHVTLAHRVPVADLGRVVAALGPMDDLETVVRDVRRWDSDARRSWTLTDPTLAP